MMPPNEQTLAPSASVNGVQFPIPTIAVEVPGPAAGNTMSKEYVQMVGRMAYFWGWPLVANANRAAAFSKVPEPGLVGGVVPIAYGGIAMLTDYITADQRVVAASNQDVVYRRQRLELAGEQCEVRHRLPQPHRHRQVEHLREPPGGDEVHLHRQRQPGPAT